MMMASNLAAILILPFFLVGLIQRTKSLWAGRRGPGLFQSFFDVLRLFSKSSVYSSTTTPLFRIAPWALLLTALGSAAITPFFGVQPIAALPFDLIWFAYAGALGRVAIMLAALDTGSPFEGMGSAREATYATILEPALFLAIGALSIRVGTSTVSEAITFHPRGGVDLLIWVGALVALFIALQVEAARLPIDDPTTHLELTMIHEVMILDHSGPDLAVIQYASALKLAVGAAIVATLMNPWSGGPGGALVNLILTGFVAVAIGTVESLIARLRLKVVPQYIAFAVGAAAVALLATTWGAS